MAFTKNWVFLMRNLCQLLSFTTWWFKIASEFLVLDRCCNYPFYQTFSNKNRKKENCASSLTAAENPKNFSKSSYVRHVFLLMLTFPLVSQTVETPMTETFEVIMIRRREKLSWAFGFALSPHSEVCCFSNTILIFFLMTDHLQAWRPRAASWFKPASLL